MENLYPKEFQLSQNFPNPFRRKTSIKYCVPQKTHIVLAVFESNGNKIQTLVDGIKKAGTYELEFDAKELDVGEYLYKLESRNYFETN